MQSILKFKYGFLLIFFIILLFFEETVSYHAETKLYKKNTINGKQAYRVEVFQKDIKIFNNELSNIYLSGNKSLKYSFPPVSVYIRNRNVFSNRSDFKDRTFLPSIIDNNTKSQHFLFHNINNASKNPNGIAYFCF